LGQLWSSLEQPFAPPAAALLYTAAGCEAWINAADKAASLQQALQAGSVDYLSGNVVSYDRAKHGRN
jgi:hypothetical protein